MEIIKSSKDLIGIYSILLGSVDFDAWFKILLVFRNRIKQLSVPIFANYGNL